MSWLIAALITFGSFAFLVTHLKAHIVRRIMGYVLFIDLAMHIGILWMFLGTSTMGLLQAEAAGILFSISFRVYRKLCGYEKFTLKGWKRYPGSLTRIVS